MAESSDGGPVESTGSQPNFVYFCQPCDEADEHTKAEGFCRHCSEFLCQTCIKYHRRNKVSKHHEILDEALMQKELKPSKRDKSGITELCPNHSTSKEPIQYYCIDHDSLGCWDCMASEHASCKIDLIVNLSSNFHDSKEFKEFCQEIEELNENFGALQAALKNSIQTKRSSLRRAFENIRKLNTDLVEHFKKLEADILTKAKTMAQNDITLLTKPGKKIQKRIKEIEEIQSCIKSKGNADCDLFIISKKTRITLKKLKESHSEIKKDCKNTPKVYAFKANKKLRDIFEYKSMGRFERLQSWIGVPYACVNRLDNIIVKSPEDQMECSISGMIPMPNRTLLLADYNNHVIKVLDLSNKSLLSCFALQAGPRDITKISDDKMAITLPTMKCVEILTFHDGKVSEMTSFNVGGECFGIDHCMDKFAVSYTDDPRIDILDMSGNVIKEIKVIDGEIILKSPKSVKFTDSDRVVVCDFKAEKVYCFYFSTSCGFLSVSTLCEKKHLYSSHDLASKLVNRYDFTPHGLALTSDKRYVITSFKNMYMPSNEAETGQSNESTTVLTDLITNSFMLLPQAVYLSEEEGLIFVGSGSGKNQHQDSDGNIIKIFKFS